MNNYTGTPEQLKIIAEAMGYEVVEITQHQCFISIKASGEWNDIYNPSTDAEQLYQCEEWVLNKNYGLAVVKGRGRLMKWLFSTAWKKRLAGRTVVKVKGWRTALVESNMTSRETITFLFGEQ